MEVGARPELKLSPKEDGALVISDFQVCGHAALSHAPGLHGRHTIIPLHLLTTHLMFSRHRKETSGYNPCV